MLLRRATPFSYRIPRHKQLLPRLNYLTNCLTSEVQLLKARGLFTQLPAPSTGTRPGNANTRNSSIHSASPVLGSVTAAATAALGLTNFVTLVLVTVVLLMVATSFATGARSAFRARRQDSSRYSGHSTWLHGRAQIGLPHRCLGINVCGP